MIVLKNGKQVLSGNTLESVDILIDDGVIVAMGQNLNAPTCIQLEGKLVLPGLIDVHVHFREPGFETKETIKTGSQAAARGGFTTVCAMPNVNPVPDTKERFVSMEALNQKDGLVQVYQYAPITMNLKSDTLVDMRAIDAFAYTNDGVGVQGAGTMYEAMKLAGSLNKPIVAHTEDDSLLYGGVMHSGQRQKALGLPGIMSIVESTQIARDVLIAHATGCHYHVCHVSTKESVEALRMGQRLGAHVTAEVTPHHLILTDMDILCDDAVFKMNPPLRSIKDRNALIEAIQDGTITIIASDHAPHTSEEKRKGFLHAPFGITGLETSFPLIYTHFVETGILTLEQVVNLMSHNPKRIFKLNAGGLKVGDRADITVFDITKSVTISESAMQSKSKNSPFINKVVKGQCELTIVNGEIVWNVI